MTGSRIAALLRIDLRLGAAFSWSAGGVPLSLMRECGLDRVQSGDPEMPRREIMLNRSVTAAAVVTLAALMMASAGAKAEDAKYPDWRGQWSRIPVQLPTQPSH